MTQGWFGKSQVDTRVKDFIDWFVTSYHAANGVKHIVNGGEWQRGKKQKGTL